MNEELYFNDELRELATRYDELQVGAVKVVTMPSNMGSILREAADTIWQLRDDLQRANAENTKLRKLLLDVWNDAMQFDGFWDYVNDDGEIYNEDELPHYYDRMRELGLEVE